jgi:hypothetical protein
VFRHRLSSADFRRVTCRADVGTGAGVGADLFSSTGDLVVVVVVVGGSVVVGALSFVGAAVAEAGW